MITPACFPSRPKPKYTSSLSQQKEGASASHVFQPDENQWELAFVDTPEEADVILLWVVPKAKPLFASDGSPLYVFLSKNGVDVAYINQLTTSKPTVLAINYTNPWVIDEVYNSSTNNIKGVLATHEALLDVVTGRFNPTGKMPFTTPISEEAVKNNKEDVPGYLEGDDYALFNYDEGLSYE